jgi:histidyl-tRNA synthetase
MTKKNTSSAKKEVPTSVKGMSDIIGEEYYAYSGFFEKASEIAMYYGFKPIETPILEKEELFLSGVGQDTDIVEKEMYSLKTKGGDHLVMRPEGTAPIMRAYVEHGMQSWTQPVMLYYKGPFFRHENPQKGRTRQFQSFGLEILGSAKAIADATVIHTTMIILKEAGLENLVLNINSIGDKECRPKYIRELANHYKKHLGELCADCKRRIKENPLRLLDCKNPKCQEVKESAPSSITHLCDECRSHFKEVLEYLEALNIPYRINNNLVRGLDYYSRTVFGRNIWRRTADRRGNRRDYCRERGKRRRKEKDRKRKRCGESQRA